MRHRFNFRHPDARAAAPLELILLALLTLLMLASLLLPVARWESLFYPSYQLKFGAVAELNNLGMIYKNDARGTYLVLDTNWRFNQPLGAEDKIIFHLSRPDAQDASRSEIKVEPQTGLRPECLAAGGCDVQLSASIRVLKEDLAEQYRLSVELSRPGVAASSAFNTPQLIQNLPQNDFDLQRMALSLGATLLICWALLRLLAPV